MKKRLIVISGFYNIVTTVAAIETINKNTIVQQPQDYYNILVIQIDRQDKKILENFAKYLFHFNEIIFVELEDINKFSYLKALFPEIDELFLPYGYHTWQPLSWEPLIALYDSKLKLIITDEGITTYRHNLYFSDFYKNEVCTYVLFPNLLVQANNGMLEHKIDYDIYLSLISKVALLDNIKIPNTSQFILYISTGWTSLPTDTTNLAIANIINRLIEKYNLPIYYKLHPRETIAKVQPILQNIKAKNRVKIITQAEAIMAETILLNPKMLFCVVECSSVLFNCYFIFNKPVFCLLFEDSKAIEADDARAIAKFSFPNIISYLDSSCGLTATEYCNLYTSFVNVAVNKFKVSPVYKILAKKANNKLEQENKEIKFYNCQLEAKKLKLKRRQKYLLLIVAAIVSVTMLFFLWNIIK